MKRRFKKYRNSTACDNDGLAAIQPDLCLDIIQVILWKKNVIQAQ